MTIKKDVVLWDNGAVRFCLFSVPVEQQYKYIDGIPCITFGISYENSDYKGCDTFTLFDHFYVSKMREIENAYQWLNGTFRIDDLGADTDGYIDFAINEGLVSVKGQLGASFSGHSLCFSFEADQTMVAVFLNALTAECASLNVL